MEIIESYIQYARGYHKEDINFSDVKKAIVDIKTMDDEHGAFWVSVIIENENVLEVEKDLTITAILEPDTENQIRTKAKNWNEVELLYKELLEGKIINLNKKLREL